MISIAEESTRRIRVRFADGQDGSSYRTEGMFRGEYLQTFFTPGEEGSLCLLTGIGEKDLGILQLKELGAVCVCRLKEQGVSKFSVDVGKILQAAEPKALCHLVEGMLEGWYEQPVISGNGKGKHWDGEKRRNAPDVQICGIPGGFREQAQRELELGVTLGNAVNWARDMVNMPGNLFTPNDFAEEVAEKMGEAGVAWEVLDSAEIRSQGLEALQAVGESSGRDACLMILRYLPLGSDVPAVGLAGKGVTCDTGGYCLKPADSMLGIKGDMAGGAAVAAAIYALAREKVQVNVIGIIPMCENRISPSSLVPGDVIGSYGGKKIEICNTDAEGRLLLADAVSYGVKHEKVKKVLDIATLTGAVVQTLGFSTAGLLSDDEDFCREFSRAFAASGERYWRLPFYEEQERMLKSRIADIKNLGEKHCGTITAALFIRAFAESRPWLHLDIAGTAWVDTPLFAFQSKGATGAGVTTLYRLMEEEAGI